GSSHKSEHREAGQGRQEALDEGGHGTPHFGAQPINALSTYGSWHDYRVARQHTANWLDSVRDLRLLADHRDGFAPSRSLYASWRCAGEQYFAGRPPEEQ